MPVTCSYAYWKFFPNSRAQRRINDVRALHDLLTRHMDDLEDVMQAMRDNFGSQASYFIGTAYPTSVQTLTAMS